MSSPANNTTRTRAYTAVTVGLGLAYLVAALGFARPGQFVDFTWPSRFDFGLGLPLGLLALYGGAWWYGRPLGNRPPRSAGWRGAVYGVLTLLGAVVLVGSWNAAEEVLRWVPFPGTTATDFYQNIGDSYYDYIVKPLFYIMPLGSVVAGLLGWWVGNRRAGTEA